VLFSRIINIPTVVLSNSAEIEWRGLGHLGFSRCVEQLGSCPQLRPATGTGLYMALELDRNLSTAPAGAASATSV
jgi:hypothetical protein